LQLQREAEERDIKDTQTPQFRVSTSITQRTRAGQTCGGKLQEEKSCVVMSELSTEI
jgi:hypothetical protein